MRRLLLSVLLTLLLAPSYSGEEPRERFVGRAQMTAKRMAIDPKNPANINVGELTYLGGVQIESGARAFGGFSAMRVDGERITLLSDGGHVVRFLLDGEMRASDVAFGELFDGPGTGWFKSDRDSESLTWDPATGKYWIGFEQSNSIWRYNANGVAEARLAPIAMVRWDSNGGPEAMTRLKSGDFIVISETSRVPGNRSARAAVLFRGDPTNARTPVIQFGYRPPAGYDPTDIAELPDGRLLVLNRRLNLPPSLFTAKLVVIERVPIANGVVLEGREIATFDRPLLRDNFEALAVTQEGGATIIWIASDDNRQWFEKSLVLKFRMD